MAIVSLVALLVVFCKEAETKCFASVAAVV